MTSDSTPKGAVAGHAALAICESLLLALSDNGVLSQDEIRGILSDAASAHRKAAALSPNPGHHHEAAADLIESMLAGGNHIRDV